MEGQAGHLHETVSEKAMGASRVPVQAAVFRAAQQCFLTAGAHCSLHDLAHALRAPVKLICRALGSCHQAPCYHLSLCVARGQLTVAVAAGGIVGLLRAPVLLGTSLRTHALHVPKHVTNRDACLATSWAGMQRSQGDKPLAQAESHAEHARTTGDNNLVCI